MRSLQALGNWLRHALTFPKARRRHRVVQRSLSSTRPAPRPESPSLHHRIAEKTPELADIQDGQLIEVRFNGLPVWIMFKCPCGRGHVISLPAAEDRRPHWSLEVRGDRVSMFPSVWQRDECFSHFWIEDGEFVWCHNSGTPPWIGAPRHYRPPK